jgi:hypothetical protein
MKAPKPEDFKFDKLSEFSPSVCFYIHQTFGLSHDIQVKNVTNRLSQQQERLPADVTDEFSNLAVASAENIEPTLLVKRESLFSARMKVMDSHRRVVAELNSSIFSLGTAKIEYPAASNHSSHNLEIKPVGLFRRAQYFVKDSAIYFWEHVNAYEKTLFKVIGSKRFIIAKWDSIQGNQHCGILLLDGKELDSVTAVISCVVQLNQSDSFTK